MNRYAPSRSSGRYFVLTQLRTVMEEIVHLHLQQGVGTIMDFGCGDSPYKPLFQAQCKEYIRADLGLAPEIDINISPDGTLPVADATFDVVVSTQVLEHVPSYELYLSECHRVLKPGGLLLLSTHGHWMYHPDPTDFWRWTGDGLVKIVNESKLEVIKRYGIMNLAATGLQYFQDGVSYKIPKKLRGIFNYGIQALQHVVDNRSITHNDASVYFIVAQKN